MCGYTHSLRLQPSIIDMPQLHSHAVRLFWRCIVIILQYKKMKIERLTTREVPSNWVLCGSIGHIIRATKCQQTLVFRLKRRMMILTSISPKSRPDPLKHDEYVDAFIFISHKEAIHAVVLGARPLLLTMHTSQVYLLESISIRTGLIQAVQYRILSKVQSIRTVSLYQVLLKRVTTAMHCTALMSSASTSSKYYKWGLRSC